MSVLNAKYPTLLDLAVMPENKDVADVVNLLAAQNPILEDAPAFECNRGLSHETTVKTGLPEVTWGRLYKGIPAGKGNMQTVKDTTGFVNSAAEVDTRYVDIFEKAEEKASVRMEMAADHLEAMAQEMATAIFYHDSSIDPSKPMGLAPRFNSFSAENASQIIDGGGSGNDNTSIWLITWDKRSCHLIYPKGHKAGVERKDRGIIPAQDSNGDRYMVYREEFAMHFGLTVRNWQYLARACNIDVSELKINASTGANIVNIMTEMYYAHKGRRSSMGKTCFYMNTTLVKFLDYQARLEQGTNLFLTFDKYGPNAKEILMFRGIPIRECDAILNSEDTVV
jgi:hypothetical protein